MPLIKVHGNNTFEWKLQLNDGVKEKRSGVFPIDGYNFEVICDTENFGSFTKNKKFLQLRLCSADDLIVPVSYTFSILDRQGHVFFTSKGKAISQGGLDLWTVKEMLFFTDTSYLKAWNLIDHGTLTVRFSIHRKPDALTHPTEVKASNVADSTTNTNSCVTKDSSTNTDGEDTSLLETLSNDFSTFYENKTDTDCVLKVSDDQFHVHRAVLSARSSVFSAMFHHDTAENRSGEVNIPDVKATALSDILYYVYSGKIRGLTADTATSIYTAADKYDLPKLRTECFEFLKRNLTMDNFCEVAILAHTHGEMELEERVVWFIEEKLDDVLESSTWQQFSKDKTLLANKLLTRGFKAAKKKLTRDINSK